LRTTNRSKRHVERRSTIDRAAERIVLAANADGEQASVTAEQSFRRKRFDRIADGTRGVPFVDGSDNRSRINSRVGA